MFTATLTPCEQLHEDIDLLDAAGWPRERIAHELSDKLGQADRSDDRRVPRLRRRLGRWRAQRHPGGAPVIGCLSALARGIPSREPR